ncbi:major facilitator superfamily domain-containing protein 6-like [Anopheles cruzii]|uniref:major facilitator superfamily domain-containing protein 6-like n=1 Tax=Anopheles cruzii TaxID=68878 RepID=UPI0022EC7FA6|nr:major facilitator superfamily domain-containing protein 6-like [Anopheles cruzii]
MDPTKQRHRDRRVNPQLVLLKVSLFLIFGAFSSLTPYLTIHMQSIGLTVEEIATVYLTLLFTSCLSPPLTGFLIDRFGRYKPVLLSAIVLNALSHHCLHLIPPRPVGVVEHNFTVRLSPDGTFLTAEGTTHCPAPTWPLNQGCQQLSGTSLRLLLNGTEDCGIYSISECTRRTLDLNATVTVHENGPRIRGASEYDRTFWTYLAVRFVASLMLASMITVTDPIALDMIEQHGGDFGRQKLYSSVGMAIFTPLTGLLIDLSSSDTDTAYGPAFYTNDALLLGSLVAVTLLPIGAKKPSANIVGNMGRILRHPHVLAFLVFLFLLGNFWGFIESYLFVIMRSMGSPNYLLGLTYTVGTVTSIPMMYLLSAITGRVGHVNLLVLAFFAHGLRILGYSWIDDPFWCFPIELNEAISCYFMWVVATTYCAVLAPSTLVATLIGVAGMVHFCLGKGIGAFVGGFLIARVGLRMAFRYVGYTAVGCGVTYKLVHLLWLHRYDQQQEQEQTQNPVLAELVKRSASIVPKADPFGSALSLPQPKTPGSEEAVPLDGKG